LTLPGPEFWQGQIPFEKIDSMGENILEFEGINKSFFGVPVLRNVSFTLQQNHILGLIGQNGAGKTTLMNILGGVIKAESGQMKLNGKAYTPQNPSDATAAGIGFIHQELNLFTNLSIADNIFIDCFPRIAGMPFIERRAVKNQAKRLLESVDLEISPDTLVEKLSLGERQLVEIAKALGSGAQIIIFDEPTTSLTARETERLFSLIENLRAGGKSIIYISHNLGNVLYLADDIVVIRDGEVVDTGAKKDFTIDRMISKMVGRDISRIYPARKTKPSTETVLEVRNLSQSGIVNNINFVLHKGEVLGLFGLMGSGRTELARIIFGLDGFQEGEIIVHGNLCRDISPRNSIKRGMAFVSENRHEEGLLMEGSVLDNIALVSLPAYSRRYLVRMVEQGRIYSAVKQVVDLLRIKSGPVERQLAKNLSGGNQQKTVVGKWLMARLPVFIMDEPTRGIDVGAKYEMYNIINNLTTEGTGVLFISSELEELIGNCDRILVMSNGQIQACFERFEFDQENILRAAFREHR